MKDDAEHLADANGQFIYSTIVRLIEMLRDVYRTELERRKKLNNDL
jgi:hypothetical protein